MKRKKKAPSRKVILRSGTFYVSSHGNICQATTRRLNDAAKAHGLSIVIISKRSPRVATIRKGNGRAIQTDRLWDLSQGLQEAAEIIHTLQHLDDKGKRRYYKKLGL